MKRNLESGTRAGSFVRLLTKVVAAGLLLTALFFLALVSVTDFGQGGNRDLRVGLPEDADWLLHVHQPGEFLALVSSELGSDLLSDQNWRWLLGLPENPAEELDPQLVDALSDSELLVSLSWSADSSKARDGENQASDRLIAAFRPRSRLIPGLLQAASQRFIYERFVAHQIPSHLSPSWLDGLIYLGGIDGKSGLVVGSSRDIVVLGNRFEDVRAYLKAQEEAPDQGTGGSEERLELSKRARTQLELATKRVLGRRIVVAARTILGSSDGRSSITWKREGPLCLQFRQESEFFRGNEALTGDSESSLLVPTSLQPSTFLPRYYSELYPESDASDLGQLEQLLQKAGAHDLRFEIVPGSGSHPQLDLGIILACENPDLLIKAEGPWKELARKGRVVGSDFVLGARGHHGADSAASNPSTMALKLRASAQVMTELIDCLESQRIKLETEPDAEHLKSLRDGLETSLGKLSEQDFQYQLQRSLAERQVRVRREMACWRSLFRQGFSWTSTIEKASVLHEIRLEN